jgi:hypothetical protein
MAVRHRPPWKTNPEGWQARGTGRIRPLADSKQATLTQKLMAATDRKPTSESCRGAPGIAPGRPQLIPQPRAEAVSFHSQIQNRPPIKKPRLIWDLGAGLLCQDYPASLEGAPKERLPPDSGEPSPGLKFNVSCRAAPGSLAVSTDGPATTPGLPLVRFGFGRLSGHGHRGKRVLRGPAGGVWPCINFPSAPHAPQPRELAFVEMQLCP